MRLLAQRTKLAPAASDERAAHSQARRSASPRTIWCRRIGPCQPIATIRKSAG
jgi:hypothetical protein